MKRYVHVTHVRHSDAATCVAEIARHCAEGRLDFLDGTVFAPDEMYLTLGRFVDNAPWTSDYTFERIYYRSIRERDSDYLTTRDFLWRWDTDWFWCSKNAGAQHPLVRRLLGRKRLNSITYQKIMRWNSRWGITRMLDRLSGRHAEAVIQDVDIPIERAVDFLAFLHREVGILPVWLCPIRPSDASRSFPLYPLKPGNGLRQLRVLGRRQDEGGAATGLPQPQDRAAKWRSSPASSRSIRTRSTTRTNSGRSTTAVRIGR